MIAEASTSCLLKPPIKSILMTLFSLYFYCLFQWSVFTCGHCICCQCAWVLLRQSGIGPRNRNVHVKCPLCRVPTVAQEISYVSTTRSQGDQASDDITVKVIVEYVC